MDKLVEILPVMLIVSGAGIWFWPRKPLPEPGSLDPEAFSHACDAYRRVTSRRYWIAMPLLMLSLALSLRAICLC